MDNSALHFLVKQAQDAEAAHNFLLAGRLYTQALEVAKKNNDSSAISVCKRKLVEVNKLSENEFKTLSTEYKLSDAQVAHVKSLVASAIADDINKTLCTIGAGRLFVPNYSEVETRARRTVPLFRQVASVTTITNAGHVVPGSSDGVMSWIKENYGIQQKVIIDLYLHPILSELTVAKKLSADTLMAYFKTRGVFPEQHLRVLQVGIARHFAGDYVSALHILVPRFESVFVDILGRAGVDVIALNRGDEVATQPRTLSERMFNDPACQKLLGDDFCKQLEFILVDPLGYKIRHRVAHGELAVEESSMQLSHLVIYLFLSIAARVQPVVNK
ncbi:MAG: DUF4209 domain-containing protein [Patescibacteria group bacterium]